MVCPKETGDEAPPAPEVFDSFAGEAQSGQRGLVVKIDEQYPVALVPKGSP
jgi:hypothetical protein